MSEKHFHEQVRFSQSYLVPFLQNQIADFERQRVLEVGCAEAGFLHVLAGMGIRRPAWSFRRIGCGSPRP